MSIDPTYAPPEEMRELVHYMPFCDIFTPNLQEAVALTGLNDPLAIINKIEQLGAQFICIKAGSQGTYFKNEDNQLEHIVPPAVNVIDTTGAGEAFVAGLLYQILKQNRSKRESIKYATICGALACTKIGGPTGMPASSDVSQLLTTE